MAARPAGAADVERIISAGGVAIDARSHDRFLGGGLQIDKRREPTSRRVRRTVVCRARRKACPSTRRVSDHYHQLGVDDQATWLRIAGRSQRVHEHLAMEHAGPRTSAVRGQLVGLVGRPDHEAATGE
jgi:hypothetical protein